MKLQLLLTGLFLNFLFIDVQAQAPGTPPFVGHQTLTVEEGFSCMPDELRETINQEIANNIQMLRSQGRLFYNEAFAPNNVLFSWPIKMADGLGNGFNQIWGISNFVDQQSGSGILDYNCGERTYNGHMGTDIYTWPFWWYMMDNSMTENIAAAEGQIVAKYDGNTDRSCTMGGGNWNAIYLQHADGSISWYGHMKNNSLTTKGIGDMVSQGEFLGITGSSGNSTGPHLHFEVHYPSNQLIDPWQGSCNALNSDSWWEDQKNYNNPAINAVLTHSLPPEFPDCPQQEIPHLEDNFDLNQNVVLAVYLTDNAASDILNLKIIRPDGTFYDNWNATLTVAYQLSYYYWQFIPDGQTGNWKWQVTYNDETVTHDFFVGVMATSENQMKKLNIYPNPAGEFFNIQSDDKIVNLQITDAQGAVLKEFKNLENYERIDIKTLPAGVYIIKAIDNKSKISSTKLIKK